MLRVPCHHRYTPWMLLYAQCVKTIMHRFDVNILYLFSSEALRIAAAKSAAMYNRDLLKECDANCTSVESAWRTLVPDIFHISNFIDRTVK